MALDHQLRRHRLDGRVDEGAGVASGEEVQARVVGEEELGGVKAGRGRKRAPRCPSRVVGEMRRVAGVAGDRVVPASRPAHGGQHEHPLQLAEGARLVRGRVGERPVRNLVAQGETARPPPEQRFDKREGCELSERLGLGGGLIQAQHIPPPQLAAF
jgi:hypothetical protein